MWIVHTFSFRRQGQDDQVGRLARRQTAGDVLPAQGGGSVQGRHAQQHVSGKVGMQAMQEACFGQDTQIGIGRQAIGPQRDARALGEKVAEPMRCMTERGMGSWAINDRDPADGLRLQIVGMHEESSRRMFKEPTNLRRGRDQAVRIKDAQAFEKLGQGTALVCEKFEFLWRLREVNGHRYFSALLVAAVDEVGQLRE